MECRQLNPFNAPKDGQPMNLKVRISIAIAAGVGLALAVLDGQGVTQVPFRIFSIGGLVATLVFALWERFIWKWKVVRYFTDVPLIAGTWRGETVSQYVLPDKTKLPPIPTAVYISQTASNVTVTLFTGESKSVSERAKLIKDPDGCWRLSWQYLNTPRPEVRDRSQPHRGAAEVTIGQQTGEGLQGSYFTDRPTQGSLHLSEWSPVRYGSSATALAGGEFQDAQPYAKGK
ncbi:Cap15 family cyclic dinucleotide receptor domain-containing protein [Kitasatospora fiedleri]|uniref:Cap15 family cyclic dinucleotide receptor domain-containing protein n=1 Tax=Kitasatospora fiedleri TaxID=2991545 RepID=UPI00384B27F7